GQFALRGAKGAVERGHERAPLQVQHRVADSATRRYTVKPAPWRARRKVRRPQQARLMRQVIEDFLAVQDVIFAGKPFRARGVTPKPEAAFSQLTMARSIFCCAMISARWSCTMRRPGEPTMSPKKRIRM